MRWEQHRREKGRERLERLNEGARELAGAYPSCNWVRGGVHPGQVASPSQDHTETNETNNHACSQGQF